MLKRAFEEELQLERLDLLAGMKAIAYLVALDI